MIANIDFLIWQGHDARTILHEYTLRQFNAYVAAAGDRLKRIYRPEDGRAR